MSLFCIQMQKQNLVKEIFMDQTAVNTLFGITESFELPDRLMSLLFTDEICEIMEKYVEAEQDLSSDGFTEYFQEEHSNRTAMMQDFTPKEVGELVARIGAEGDNINSVLDVCAGTGGLTIAAHNLLPSATFYCEELSKRAVPLLLFNLAVRNISAYVSNKDVLTGKTFEAYRIAKGERFGRVEKLETITETAVDLCITNPPYSVKFEFKDGKDPRFSEYGCPPKQYADLAFIIHGLSRLNTGGRLVAILPCGTLFRGSKEGEIRKKMVENGIIHAVIGLPDKLFINTDIPVTIQLLKKERSESVLFIEGSREFRKCNKKNRLEKENIEKIFFTLSKKLEVNKYSHLAGLPEIRENNYNLNITRYVDTFEPPPPIDIAAVVEELKSIDAEISEAEHELYMKLKELRSESSEKTAELELLKEYFGGKNDNSLQNGSAC